jgi:hypothetical protein
MGLPIAGHWFEFERLGDDITRIWEPHVIRVMQCNVWHVQGRDRDLIIDTGMGLGNLTRAAAEVFSKPLTATSVRRVSTVPTKQTTDRPRDLFRPDRFMQP